MNKKMQELVATVNANPADETAKKELTDLGVKKFKQVYGRIQEAVKTINRHLAPGKGHPNRAKLATAIGLKDEILKYGEVGALIGMPEMETAVTELTAISEAIAHMREKREFGHIAYLPDFLTEAETNEVTENDLKLYLYNITNAVNAAAENIGKHYVDGDFDPNTYTVAKAIGYADDAVALGEDFGELARATGKDFSAEITQTQALAAVIAVIKDSRDANFKTAVSKVAEYDPFPADEEDDETEGDLSADEDE